MHPLMLLLEPVNLTLVVRRQLVPLLHAMVLFPLLEFVALIPLVPFTAVEAGSLRPSFWNTARS